MSFLLLVGDICHFCYKIALYAISATKWLYMSILADRIEAESLISCKKKKKRNLLIFYMEEQTMPDTCFRYGQLYGGYARGRREKGILRIYKA